MARSAAMSAVGDIQFSKEPSDLLHSDAISTFKKSSLNVANLEVVLSKCEEQEDKGKSNLRTDPSLAPILSQLNCRVLGFANNHAFDFGSRGLLDTVDEVGKLGIRIVGAGRNLEEAQAPVYTELGETRVSFVAFSSSFRPGATASATSSGIFTVDVSALWELNSRLQVGQPGSPPRVLTKARQEDISVVKRRVSQAAAQSDIVVVLAHWGVAYRYDLTDYQRQVAHELVDAGAHLILGSHPHVIQGVERYKSGLIFYSLGNFIFQAEDLPPWGTGHRSPLWKHWSRQSIMVNTYLSSGRISTTEIWPIRLSDEGTPYFAKGLEAHQILDTLSRLTESEGSKLTVNHDKEMATI
jgi:poly-gamma-glutamate capsule biosynthesis protein CapA/YwtB (metallophosphatase superfamily)